MFSSIFFFEIRRLLQSISTYIYFFILFLVTFFMALFIGGAFKDVNVNIAGEKIYANSPIIIDSFFSGISSWIGAIIIVAVIGNAVLKDFKYNIHNLIFTTPVTKFDYLFGRFSAALVVCLLIITGPAFGMIAGYASPWVNPDKIEAFRLLPYIQTYWQTIIPNILLEGAIFFAVSLISRDIFVIWLSLIIFWVATGVSNAFFSSLDHETPSALIDPLGGHAKRAVSKYWSTYDKNHLVYEMSGLFLWNRLLWLGISLFIFISGYLSFSFTSAPRRISFGRKKVSENPKTVSFARPAFKKTILSGIATSFTTKANLTNLWGLTANECKTLWRNTYFRIILLFGMLFLFLTSPQIGKIFDTPTYPVTYQVIEVFGGTFQLFIIILTIIFGGEIVWRARENHMDNILDALPVPNWVFYVSKLAGLMFMQLLLVSIIMVCGILVQLFKGYTHFEIWLYIKYLIGFRLIDFWLLAVLCVFVHTLVRNKFVGYFIVALFYTWNTFFAALVFKHNLLVFSSDPGLVYSDMNGFGHSVFPFYVFKLYWGAFALCLGVWSVLLWARGSDYRLRWRFSQANGPAKKRALAVFAVGMVIFIGCGSFIYYNTNVENKFITNYKFEEMQASYEKKYKKYEFLPQPKITDVALKVDLFPNERSVHATGTYVLQNKSNTPIDSIHLILPMDIKAKTIAFSKPFLLAINDSAYYYRIYRLSTPLAIGDTVTLSFDLSMVNTGFTHDFSGLGTPLYNGTFINNENFLPSIGYNKGLEVGDNASRKKHGLGYRATSNKITDTAAYGSNLFTRDADFITFDATVSTVPDQIAIVPGYLQKEWTKNGRRFFHYKMDSKILNFYSFLSARYTVKKEIWNNISLEIYYQQGHEYNLGHMFEGMKKALTYYTANYSPYQHRQVRILEFPRYASFAQSFPNTIPFSEGIGFIADVDTSNKDDIDYPFYITAHEVAHQWFAHQIIGADVEGSNMMSESFAEYSAIAVLEKEYGLQRMSKFLHIDLDHYLTARSNESEKEKPLAYVDISQSYIYYQKGSIIMHGLGKYIGEDSLNHALRRFIERYAFKGPPYPTTIDFLGYLRAVTPDSLQYLVTDGFEKIVVYDNKITDARSTKNGDQYTVTVDLDINKLSADTQGHETPVQCNDYIEIAVYKDRNTIMRNDRYKLQSGTRKLEITVPEKPYKVVIDPRYLLIDKKPEDNEKKLDGGENEKTRT